MEEQIIENTEEIKFHSLWAINLATFIGGPLAGGILIYRNFKNLGKNKDARNSLLISILAIIVVFCGLCLLPENIIKKISIFLIPVICTLVVWFLVYIYQGEELKKRKGYRNLIYSVWKACIVGIICFFTTLVIILSVYIINLPYGNYNDYLSDYIENEKKALVAYEMVANQVDNKKIVEYIDDIAIPAWKKNLKMLRKINNIPGMQKEKRLYNQKLITYTSLRIEQYRLLRKVVGENTTKYDKEYGKIGSQISDLQYFMKLDNYAKDSICNKQ